MTSITDWCSQPETCWCGKPLREHWRGKPCLQENDPEISDPINKADKFSRIIR
jgi:hypothetical protein